jgi:hypothetical protein
VDPDGNGLLGTVRICELSLLDIAWRGRRGRGRGGVGVGVG